jgi:hypothetical protein
MANMADMKLTAKVSSEGRIVVPAEVRKELKLQAGDLVHFAFDADAGDWRIFTSRLLIDQLWANNTGGDAVNSTEIVRYERTHDQLVEEDAEERVAADAAQPWNEEAETQRLLTALGLA